MTGRSEVPNPEAEAAGPATGNWAARHDLALYFVLAYLLSWALWPLVILNPSSSPLVPFGHGEAAPTQTGRRSLTSSCRP
jgi:hypothetical protein